MYFCTRMIFKCHIHVPPPNECEGKATCRLKQLLSQYDLLVQATGLRYTRVPRAAQKSLQPVLPKTEMALYQHEFYPALLNTRQYSPSSHFSWASLPDFIRPTEEAETPNSPGVNSSYMWGMAGNLQCLPLWTNSTDLYFWYLFVNRQI